MHDSEHKQRTRSIPIFSCSRIYTVDSSKDISEKISTTFLLKTLKIILFAAGKENDKNLSKMLSGQKSKERLKNCPPLLSTFLLQ